LLFFGNSASALWKRDLIFPQIHELAQNLLESPAFPRVTNFSVAFELATLIVNHESAQVQKMVPPDPFNCSNTGRSNPRPTDAQKLLPGDVDVVMALGDSLVAAFGALSTSFFNLFTEYRGVSFCVGGQDNFETFVTIPNILKKYNPNLKGFSIGNGKQTSANAVLNVAVSGARSYDLMPQFDSLYTKLQNGYDIQNDWKLVNLFVGGNDLCDYCSDTTKHSPQNFRAHIERSLDAMKATFPKTFVNLMAPPDVTLLSQMSTGLCGILHGYECACATDPATHLIYRDYIQQLHDLALLPKYHDKEDFHVSFQPFLVEVQIPTGPDGKPDTSYFAPDCFHFSGKAHQAAAVALWNNMLESENKKKTWYPGEPIECPVQGQYLA